MSVEKDHPLALGFNEYKYTLKEQSKYVPVEHQRLYQQTKEQDLHDILINRLYDQLRKIKVVPEEEALPKDTRNETYVREVVYTEQLKHSMIQEEMLKDLLADAHQGNSKLQEGTIRSLSLEHRLRAYSSRFDKAKEEAALYDYLKDEYRAFEEERRVSSDSKPMYEFYEVESRYYNGVMDKYRYLLNQSFISKVNVDGAFYSIPKGSEEVSSLEVYIESRDWKSWFEENEGVLDYQCDQFELNGESTLDFQANQYQNVSDMLFEYSEDLELSERDRYRLNVVRSVSELAYEQVQRQQHVSKERFDEVKTYDLPKLTYDLNVGVDRHVSPAAKDSFNDLNEERRIKTARALDYLKATQQEAGPAYRYYVGSLKEREFDRLCLEDLNDTLPIPTRERTEAYEADYASYAEIKGLSEESALRLVRHYIPEAQAQVHTATLGLDVVPEVDDQMIESSFERAHEAYLREEAQQAKEAQYEGRMVDFDF